MKFVYVKDFIFKIRTSRNRNSIINNSIVRGDIFPSIFGIIYYTCNYNLL